MKKLIKLPVIVLGLLLLLTGTTPRVMAQDEDISLQSFYDELSPYGTWIQDPQYGYVWRPDADQGDFRPYYTNGRWAMTEYGNTWVSNYDWGWAPFHYGRWVYNRYNQWVWIPDTVWGPAWVSWRSGGGYYGWAPMGPGMHINVNFNIPDLWWVFVPQRNIYYDNFPRYYSRRNITIIHNTTIINNVYTRNRYSYYTGPRADEIRRYTRQAVPVYTVNRVSRPSRSGISGNKLEIYTPTRSSRGNNSQVAAAPRNATRGEGYTTMRDQSDARPSRGSVDNSGFNRGNSNNTEGRVSRTGGAQPGQAATPNQPQRVGRGEQPAQTERTERVSRDVQNQREQTQDAARQEQAQRQSRAEQQVRQQQAAQEQAQRQSREQTQRQEQARQAPVQQQQPQRQESRPAPQPQPQRVEQSRPSRGSESSGSQGGGRGSSSSSSRPTRGGR